MMLKDMRDEFNENGYTVFNIGDEKLIDQVNTDVDHILSSAEVKTNSKIYSYNDSPRVVESYKHSEACLKLAKHPKVIGVLKTLYEREPLPFSTINFMRSTQQPLHSDYVHFGTVPPLLLAGSWIALEDIDPSSGPLQVVPKSHKLKVFEFAEVVGDLPKSLADVKRQYELYEEWVLKLVSDSGLTAITPNLKKGDCIIWDANMLHGSPTCLDNSLSRRSQVTHWSFEGVEMHYNPNFSTPSAHKFVERKVEYF